MENQAISIQFRLAHIATEQFAIIEQSFKGADVTAQYKVNLSYGKDVAHRMIIVILNFHFEHEKNPFLIVEVACHFQLSEESWKLCTEEMDGTYVIPQSIITQLSMLTVGAARGVLHSKTEGTPLNQFILPPINLLELIQSDFRV